jgi:hypothetical protein
MTQAFLATEVTAKYSIVDSIASLAILRYATLMSQVHIIGGATIWW